MYTINASLALHPRIGDGKGDFVMPLSRGWIVVLLLSFVLLPGCQRTYHPVHGTVYFADRLDQPATELAGYMITVEPVEKTQPIGANGKIKDDGTFILGTETDTDGVLVGKQRVAITPPFDQEGTMRPSLILEKYKDLSTSELVIEVKPENNEIKIVVERKKKG